MDHISTDAAFIQHPTVSHPPMPAPTGGRLRAPSGLWQEGR